MAKREVKRADPTTYAGWLEREYEQFEIHHREDHVPEVNYKFTPGDEVHFGSMEDAYVEEVLEDAAVCLYRNGPDETRKATLVSEYTRPYRNPTVNRERLVREGRDTKITLPRAAS